MFYRPGGNAQRINPQTDTVYADATTDGNNATGWLPVSRGNEIAVNISRAKLIYNNSADSQIIPSPIQPEAQVVLEMKMYASDRGVNADPIDTWQNLLVATSRRAHREGWVRLRIVSINNSDGSGLKMSLQISRTGESGAVT